MQRYALKDIWRNGFHSFKLRKDKKGNFVSYRTAMKEINALKKENEELKKELNDLVEDIVEEELKN
jgi:hypothetical protein